MAAPARLVEASDSASPQKAGDRSAVISKTAPDKQRTARFGDFFNGIGQTEKSRAVTRRSVDDRKADMLGTMLFVAL